MDKMDFNKAQLTRRGKVNDFADTITVVEEVVRQELQTAVEALPEPLDQIVPLYLSFQKTDSNGKLVKQNSCACSNALIVSSSLDI